jgi:3-hydroxyacyl-CoA dehydrogenase/enoyl-CoA hydratase/3-hydroxybutyryl-CoA epimerase/enoyl-CoA isomerase
MSYQGVAFSVSEIESGIYNLKFDYQNQSVNKFSQEALEDLNSALEAIEKISDLKGVILSSGKDVFVVGADITEFKDLFAEPQDVIVEWTLKANRIFSRLEDLPCPTVAAVNGVALGGGLEVCLATDYRVLSEKALVGLTEVKLGLFPGFGGTVRMLRLVGPDNAIEWICAGKQNKPAAALASGVADAVVAPEDLMDASLSLVKEILEGKLDYKARRQAKLEPLAMEALESMMAFQSGGAVVAGQAGRNYPAPMKAVKVMQQHAGMKRDQAIEVEASGFAELAQTSEASALIGIFMKDQAIKKGAGKWAKLGETVTKAGVLGAGIMGGGISYQSSVKGTPVIMKDIRDEALDLGMSEASKLLNKQLKRKKIDGVKMAKTLSNITPTLNFGDFKTIDYVVEAVVENEKIKKAVLAEVEGEVSEDTILASNTSTISITRLAEGLKRPENFIGMHFFNPVHMMPLVEIIKGEESSEKAIGTGVAYAKQMGKTPIVVKDCPGFLVNRVLFPYFGGFAMLVRDGVDFQQADKVMEKFGWPMGPAYLLDVVGIDTAVHAQAVMSEGFPDRMTYDFKDAAEIMFENDRLGQKNDKGFYVYELDKKGKSKKVVTQDSYDLLKPHVNETKEFEPQEIIDRLMIPMCLELVRCLDEQIVETVADADMALIMGVGFPPFRGGVFEYMDSVGLAKFVEKCDALKDELGPLYDAPESLRQKAAAGETYN